MLEKAVKVLASLDACSLFVPDIGFVKAIDNERPNIVSAFLSKTFWGAALDRDGEPDDKSWYEILVDVFDYYESACRRIVHNPHRRYEAAVEW